MLSKEVWRARLYGGLSESGLRRAERTMLDHDRLGDVDDVDVVREDDKDGYAERDENDCVSMIG
jgi:hypothetical protein